MAITIKQAVINVCDNLEPGEKLLGYELYNRTLAGVADGLADWLDEIDAAFGGCIPRVEKNVADRASRIKAIGNGQVPQVAALAFELLKGDWT